MKFLKKIHRFSERKGTKKKKVVDANCGGLLSEASTMTVEHPPSQCCQSSSISSSSNNSADGYQNNNGNNDEASTACSINNNNLNQGCDSKSKRCAVKKMMSGKLSSHGKVLIFNNSNIDGSVEVEVVRKQHLTTTLSLPSTATASITREMLPVVNEPSSDSDCCSSSSSWSDPFYQAQTGALIEDDIASEADDVAKRMVSQLTEEELDIAMKSSYEYYLMKIKNRMIHSPGTEIPEYTMYCKDTLERVWKDRNCSKWTEEQIDRFGYQAAVILAKRILINMGMKEKAAQQKFKDGLQYRISDGGAQLSTNTARFLFYTENNEKNDYDNDVFATYRTRITRFMGDKARTFVVNYDREGRAQLYSTVRFYFPESREDLDGLLGSHGYVFERALACTNRHSKGKQDMVNIILDFKGFVRKDHALPLFMAHEFLNKIKENFSERIHTIYIVDAPLIARVVIGMLKPFIITFIVKDLIMVTGKKQREQFLGKELHETCTENVDMNKYYSIPFDQCYTDVYDL